MSDISNAAQDTPRHEDEAIPADGPRVASHPHRGKVRVIAAAAAAVGLGVAWIVLRVTKASVRRHPAIRVTRAGVGAVRDR